MLEKQFSVFENYCEGTLGVSAMHIETGREIGYKCDQLFLMCSTYKLPIAIYLLHQAEKKHIDLNELYTMKEPDLRSGYAFTLNDFDCSAGFPISLRNLLLMMLRESCNTSTDILLKRIGGPHAVTAYLHQSGISDIRIDSFTVDIIAASENPEERKNFIASQKDTSTPDAMKNLLVKLFKKELLNTENTTWMLNTLRRNKLYPNRLMGLLPHKTPVAHKTGTATGFTHDVGIITLPHESGHIAISAFIKDSRKDKVPNERVLAEVGRTIYDFFLLNLSS